MRIFWLSSTMDEGLRWSGTTVSVSCARELRRLGHDVIVKGLSERRAKASVGDFRRKGLGLPKRRVLRHILNTVYPLEREVARYRPDVIVTLAPDGRLAKAARAVGSKLVLWSIDDPTHLDESRFSFIQHCDLVLTQSLGSVPVYRSQGARRVEWLPLACDPSIHRRTESKPLFDIVFFGNFHYSREPGCKRLLYPLIEKGFDVRVFGLRWPSEKPFMAPIRWTEFGRVYSSAKIALCVHREPARLCELSPNTRVFEVMGSRCFLLSDDFAGAESYFSVGKDLAIARDSTEVIELARYYLENCEEREAIAERGQNTVYSRDTYRHRVKLLCERLSDLV